jgi:hypothetical protein
MTLVLSNPFTTNFTNIPTLQSLNSNVAGSSNGGAGIATRIEIVNGVFRARIVDTDDETFGGIRSECVFAPMALNDEFWFTFEVMVNRAEWADAGGPISLFQVHNLDSINSAVNFLALLDNDRWLVRVPHYALPATGNAGNFRTAKMIPFQFGVWNKVAFHGVWKNAATGIRELFINGDKVFSEWAVGTAYNSDAPYFKMGVYDVEDTAFGTKTAYFRNLNVYSGVESYQTVLGRAPMAPLLKVA